MQMYQTVIRINTQLLQYADLSMTSIWNAVTNEKEDYYNLQYKLIFGSKK